MCSPKIFLPTVRLFPKELALKEIVELMLILREGVGELL
jgi:hypothetical protein